MFRPHRFLFAISLACAATAHAEQADRRPLASLETKADSRSVVTAREPELDVRRFNFRFCPITLFHGEAQFGLDVALSSRLSIGPTFAIGKKAEGATDPAETFKTAGLRAAFLLTSNGDQSGFYLGTSVLAQTATFSMDSTGFTPAGTATVHAIEIRPILGYQGIAPSGLSFQGGVGARLSYGVTDFRLSNGVPMTVPRTAPALELNIGYAF